MAKKNHKSKKSWKSKKSKKSHGVTEYDTAKNKQKTPTQPQTTKNLDLSDPRKVERFVSGEFEVSRQYLKKIRKEHPERKNVLLETEMVEPLYSRRIRAAANYLPVMMKHFEKYQSVKPDDYTVFFAQPTLSISSLDYRGSLSTGAALWILDKPIRYFAYASATKCAEQVVAEDRKG